MQVIIRNVISDLYVQALGPTEDSRLTLCEHPMDAQSFTTEEANEWVERQDNPDEWLYEIVA